MTFVEDKFIGLYSTLRPPLRMDHRFTIRSRKENGVRKYITNYEPMQLPLGRVYKETGVGYDHPINKQQNTIGSKSL